MNAIAKDAVDAGRLVAVLDAQRAAFLRDGSPSLASRRADLAKLKRALLNLSQAMAAQLKDKGVYVQVVLPGATRTELWEKAGRDVNTFPEGFLMEVGDMVDAALVGFDLRETVTIPPLADEDQFTAMQQARLAMAPNLSKSKVAPRYRRQALI